MIATAGLVLGYVHKLTGTNKKVIKQHEEKYLADDEEPTEDIESDDPAGALQRELNELKRKVNGATTMP